VSKLRGLSLAEWHLLWRTAGWVVLIRLLLWLRPFPVVQRRVDAWAQSGGRGRYDAATIASVSRFVAALGRWVPGASCLTQALAAQIVLGRLGCATVLRLGVGRDAEARFAAHAWLERDDQIILGAAPVAQFTPLPVFEAR
jgi:hypothetical protein